MPRGTYTAPRAEGGGNHGVEGFHASARSDSSSRGYASARGNSAVRSNAAAGVDATARAYPAVCAHCSRSAYDGSARSTSRRGRVRWGRFFLASPSSWKRGGPYSRGA